MAETKNAVQATTTTAAMNMSERFTNKVLTEFGSNAGPLRISDYQRSLVQGYFVGISRALEKAEEERQHKNERNSDPKWNNNTPITWQNVNMQDLALDVVHYARLGLDMMQENHISPIPYKNKKTGQYDITLMPGYNGIRYIAENYALIKPKSVTIDLVYSTDTFKPIKKSVSHPIEAYEFEITNPFDRGQLVGGFGYIEYDDPARNELVIMTMKDIMKRKPKYASANFWGGEVKDFKTKSTEMVDGWLEEMCKKTLVREVYSAKHIPRDPRKIDESYMYMRNQEQRMAEAERNIREEINVTAVTTPIESVAIPAIPEPSVEAVEPVKATKKATTKSKAKASDEAPLDIASEAPMF